MTAAIKDHRGGNHRTLGGAREGCRHHRHADNSGGRRQPRALPSSSNHAQHKRPPESRTRDGASPISARSERLPPGTRRRPRSSPRRRHVLTSTAAIVPARPAQSTSIHNAGPTPGALHHACDGYASRVAAGVVIIGISSPRALRRTGNPAEAGLHGPAPAPMKEPAPAPAPARWRRRRESRETDASPGSTTSSTGISLGRWPHRAMRRQRLLLSV